MIMDKNHPFWEIGMAKEGIAASVCNDWEAIPYEQHKEISLEVTISLRKDSKDYLYRIYCKLLKGIDNKYPIKAHEAYYELGGVKQHRHIHAKITISVPLIGSHAGLIEELARLFCVIIRRKYNEKHMYFSLERYHSVPITIQINKRDSWDEYIKKSARPEKILFS